MTQPPHRVRASFRGIVLLQAALLLASVITVPAPVIAQDPPAPGSQQEGEPSVEPEPEPSASPEASSSAEPSSDPALLPEASPPVESAPPSSSADELASPAPGTSASAPADSRASTERNRVTLVAAADIDRNGAFDDLVTVESPPGTILQNVRAVSVPTDPPPPPGIFFPAGLFEYEVVVAEPGDAAAVTFHLPDGTIRHEVDTEFWVLQNGRWSDLTARADADHATDEVTVTLVDGGAGDEDLRADGTIDDPGGLGVPRDPWTFTVTVSASVDPAAEFNFFLEECSETGSTTACTPQPTRLWVNPEEFGPTITNPQPVTLSHGESFTWDQLDPDRHYRVIEVGPLVTVPPGPTEPGDDTGEPPPGWELTGFECDSVGATLFGEEDNSIAARLNETTAEGVTDPGWAVCSVAHFRLSDPRANALSTITARKWGDRAADGTNQPLNGATMGLWRDDGDGEFEPGTGDVFVTSCVTGAGGAAAGQCVFVNLAAGGYWVQEISVSNPAFNTITTWAPGSFIIDNPPLPYAAHRYGDPAADRSPNFDGYPLVVDGNANNGLNSHKVTDWFANSRVNPPLPALQCADLLRVVLVLDRSGSINDNGSANYETAALAFVNDLVGTNTEIGIVSFAATASAASPLGSPYQNVQASNGTLDTVIAAIYDNLGGGTNWDGGLQLSATSFDPNPHLVVFITDGNPTANNLPGGATSTGEVNWDDYTEAVTSANRLKSGDGAGPQPESRVFAIGAGRAGTISQENFWGVAGPVTNQANVLANDYLVGTADELGDALRALALALCSASLDIEKTSVGGTATFDYTVNGTGLTPFTRNTAVANPTTSAPFEFTAPQFGVKYVQESPEPGWTLTNIVCTANGAEITIGTGIGLGFASPGGCRLQPGDTTVRADLGDDDAPTCTFTNTQNASLDIEKQSVGGGTATFDFTGSGLNVPTAFTRNTAVANPTTSAPFAFTATQFGTKMVTETPEPGWTLTNIVCTGNPAGLIIGRFVSGVFQTGGSDGFDPGDTTVSVAIEAGNNVSCTYTNTQNASLDIEKTTVGGTATFDYAVDGTGLAPFTRNTAVANPTTSAPFPFSGLQLGTKDVQELPEAGWTLTNIVCSAVGAEITIGTGIGATFAPGATLGFDPGDTTVRAVITGGDAPTCTFTNTADATITVTKDAVPNADQLFQFATTGTGGGTLFQGGSFFLDDDPASGTANTLHLHLHGRRRDRPQDDPGDPAGPRLDPHQPGLLEGHDQSGHRPRQHRPAAR